MQEILLDNYLLIKALHIISVISWMAGMLYLPRLFVYHADAKTGSDLSETLKTMERRLLRYIINPAMIASFVFAGLMFWVSPELIKQPWMHAKLTLIFLMVGLHHMFARYRKKFDRDENVKTAKFFRIMNEAPTVLMIFIVILAVTKPF